MPAFSHSAPFRAYLALYSQLCWGADRFQGSTTDSFPSSCCERLEIELLLRVTSSTIHKVILQISALRTPYFKSCTALKEGSVWHFTTEIWSYLYGAEGKLSHPLDDILNLNTTLTPAKIKKYTRLSKVTMKGVELANAQFFGTFSVLGQKTWLGEESPWIILLCLLLSLR